MLGMMKGTDPKFSVVPPLTPIKVKDFELWPLTRGYKTFYMLNSTEHEISTGHQNQNTDK